MPTIAELLQCSRRDWTPRGLPASEISLLLGNALARDAVSLITDSKCQVDAAARRRFESLLAQRLRGAPIAYLTRSREFWSLDLYVDERVLIPRHETETLVERALTKLPRRDPAKVLDLGVGSGAVALAVASERPRALVLAIDREADAIEVAEINARRHRLGNLRFAVSDWFEGVTGGPFQVICANPPYVAGNDPHLQRGDARFEPRAALAAGADGLSELEKIIPEAVAHLAPGAWLVVEHGHDQGQAVRALFESSGYVEVQTTADLAGRERVCEGRRPGARGGA